MRILYTWIGERDFDHQDGKRSGSAIASITEAHTFDKIIVLHNFKTPGEYPYENERLNAYTDWLRKNWKVEILPPIFKELKDPTDLSGVKTIASEALRENDFESSEIFFNLSSGTWAMSWTWFFLSQTNTDATLLQASPEAGVKAVEVPFEISGQKLFMNWNPTKEKLTRAESLFDPDMNGPYSSYKLKKTIQKALKAAQTNIPILILGERGCPKNYLAKGIHENSLRANQKNGFINIDCFYYKDSCIEPVIEKSEGSTVFLENMEFLSEKNQKFIFESFLSSQEQMGESYLTEFESEVSEQENPSSSSKGKLDVRLILATTLNLEKLRDTSHFSLNFFEAITQIILHIPPLREREEDIHKVIEGHFQKFKKQNRSNVSLSIAAKEVLIKYHWPGNDNELDKVLNQLILFANANEITNAEAMEALFELPSDPDHSGIPTKHLEKDFNLREHLNEEARKYILRAESEYGGNLKKMAKGLGYENHQTLAARMRSLKIKGS